MRGGGCDDHILSDGRLHLSPFSPAPKEQVRSIGIRGFPAGAIGDHVVAYLDYIGRVEGRIVRRSQTWFAVDIVATPRKLERLATKLSCLVENETQGGEPTPKASDGPEPSRLSKAKLQNVYS